MSLEPTRLTVRSYRREFRGGAGPRMFVVGRMSPVRLLLLWHLRLRGDLWLPLRPLPGNLVWSVRRMRRWLAK